MPISMFNPTELNTTKSIPSTNHLTSHFMQATLWERLHNWRLFKSEGVKLMGEESYISTRTTEFSMGVR
jgi:hypothetical protein